MFFPASALLGCLLQPLSRTRLSKKNVTQTRHSPARPRNDRDNRPRNYSPEAQASVNFSAGRPSPSSTSPFTARKRQRRANDDDDDDGSAPFRQAKQQRSDDGQVLSLLTHSPKETSTPTDCFPPHRPPSPSFLFLSDPHPNNPE
jgi:hypothetical protein